jgi:hypothetical protein
MQIAKFGAKNQLLDEKSSMMYPSSALQQLSGLSGL